MGYLGRVAHGHHDAASGNVSSFAVTITTTAPVGSRVLLAVNAPAVTLMSGFTAVDSKGNTWTARGFRGHATAANAQVGLLAAEITTALLSTGTPDTITVSSIDKSPGKWAVVAVAFDDIDGGTAYDTTAGPGVNSATSLAVTSGDTASASQNQELVFGAVGFTDASAAVTFTPSGGFTAETKETADPSSSPKGLVVCWAYVDAAGARSFAGNLSSSQAWASVVGAWKQTFPAPTASVWNWKDAGGVNHPADLIPL